MIEQIFFVLFKSGMKLDAFYKLVTESIKTENDITKAYKEGDGQILKNCGKNNSRLALEVAQSFYKSSSYFYSYMLR